MDGTRHGGEATRIFADLPELETERLLLRKLRLSDAEAVFAYASDSEVTRYVLWDTHGSIEDSENFLRFANEGYERGDFGGWGLVLKASGAFVGTCGMEAAPDTRAPSSDTSSHASTGEEASCPRPCGG